MVALPWQLFVGQPGCEGRGEFPDLIKRFNKMGKLVFGGEDNTIFGPFGTLNNIKDLIGSNEEGLYLVQTFLHVLVHSYLYY